MELNTSKTLAAYTLDAGEHKSLFLGQNYFDTTNISNI